MKKINLVLVSVISVGILVGGIVKVSALTTPKTKADILADLTGKSTSEIIEQKNNENKSYGNIALENGVLEEFKASNLEIIKDNIKKRVEEGSLTQENANQMIEKIENNMKDCDGSKTNSNQHLGLGNHNGLKDGSSSRNNRGQGKGIHRQ